MLLSVVYGEGTFKLADKYLGNLTGEINPQIWYELTQKTRNQVKELVYHVPIIQKNNSEVQYKKTREYTTFCMLHRYVIFTSCLLRLTVNVQ